ncbi:MAG: Glu/Leu/Phe/Val dehydrogenase [Bacteroidota bacterium]
MVEVKDMNEAGISRDLVFGNKSFAEHEEVVFCYDKKTGLKAIIAIHDTTLGPALGGTRMWMYKSEAEALNDVLRLSRGMTFKAAISGLELGGGKAVIIGDARKDKTPELFRKYGEFIDSLKGRYITAEDVGTSTSDMVYVHERTKYVTGLPENMGGSGDPSPVTAYGVYMGMKASAMEMWGDDSLRGKKIAIQGVGHVGENLVRYVSEEGAKVFITDINKELLEAVSKKFGAEIVAPDAVYDLDIDIYAPCALGATLTTENIGRLKCVIVSGAANNQLADEYIHGRMLTDKGILYAPDFLINAGGLINVYSEIKGYDREASLLKAKNIYTTTLEIFKKAKMENISTATAARVIAEERLAAAKKS